MTNVGFLPISLRRYFPGQEDPVRASRNPVKGHTEIPPAPVYRGIRKGGERTMEGILLGSGVFATTMPIYLGLLVLGFGVAGIALGHASDSEAVGRRVYWAEWPVPEEKKPIAPEPGKSERPGEEKEHIRKAA